MQIAESIRARLIALRVSVDDLSESFTRSSGPGGQHVNKVSTAVEILHRPTGLRIVASDSRSQSTNRQLAILRLVEELERQKAARKQERLAALSKQRRQRAKRSKSTKRKLVEGKRLRGETKKLRGKVSL